MTHFSAKNDARDEQVTSSRNPPMLHKLQSGNETKELLLNSFAKVERAKQEWESTVDALPELICVIDGNGRIVRTNRTVEDWGLGSVTDVQGNDLHTLIHPTCVQPCPLDTFLMQTRQKIFNDGTIEAEAFDPHLQRFIQMRGRPVLMKRASKESHWVIILHDITDRKEMEQALHRQNGRLAAINAINQAILTAQSPEEIAQATLTHLQALIPFQSAHILLNLPQEHELLVLATINNDFPHLSRPGQRLARTEFNGSDRIKLSHFFKVEKLNGLSNPTLLEQRWREQDIQSYINFPLIMGKNFIGVLQLFVIDPPTFDPDHVTIVREVAEILTIAINQSQLYQKLEQGNKELQALLRAKHEMMQNVSHDLRSPLALIKGYTELLQSGLYGVLTAEQQEALAVLETKGDQMLFLINRLFKIQTIDKHTLNKTALDPKRFLEQVAKSWQVLTTNKSIHLQLDILDQMPTLMADSDMLNQVLSNLLDNALKFSSEGDSITIRAQTKNNTFILTVEDEGRGIAQNNLEQIFDRFYQVDKGSIQSQAGAGIGLALCKTIVEAHDGRIWAESAGQGQGSAFFISLPTKTTTEP